MSGYLLTSMMAGQAGRPIPRGLIAMAEKDQQEDEAQNMKAKIAGQIKDVKAAQKKVDAEGKEDNGTQIFAEMADMMFQPEQMELGIQAANAEAQNRQNANMLTNPLLSPLNLLNKGQLNRVV